MKQRAVRQLSLTASHVDDGRPLSGSDQQILGPLKDPLQRALTNLQRVVQGAASPPQ